MNLADYLRRLEAPDPPFDTLATTLWTYQREAVPALRAYCAELQALGLPVDQPQPVPVAFFKHLALKDGDWEAGAVFESSGTTGQQPSRHHVRDLAFYARNARRGFEHFFPAGPYRILALLPSYLERGNSSLVQMVRGWIADFGRPGSGFFLHDFAAMRQAAQAAAAAGEPVLLIGVAFALLDFLAAAPLSLPPGSLAIETGGMKGRREELSRPELHARLQAGLPGTPIHSEYGMTELLSQAYTDASGRFRCPPTMRVRVADFHLDRLTQPPGVSGRLLITDLANVHSCAFIATDDIGRQYADGTFEVLGRIDAAELRGCNLMYI